MPGKYRRPKQDRRLEFVGLMFILLIVFVSLITGVLIGVNAAKASPIQNPATMNGASLAPNIAGSQSVSGSRCGRPW